MLSWPRMASLSTGGGVRKKPAKRKTKPLGKVVEDVAVELQKLVRLKAALAAGRDGLAQCVTCEKWKHWKELQGGHFIERGKAHKILEENINPQCAYCNQWGMKKASVVLTYRRWMVDMHGEKFVKELEDTKNRAVKRFRPDLEDRLKELRARNRDLAARL